MRKQLRKKEIKAINLELKQTYGLEDFLGKNKVEVDDDKVFVDNECLFYYHKNKILPTLKLILKNNFLKKVTVDMGAIKFISSGADVMRPGVTKVDEGMQQNELVVVVDETYGKALAIGACLFSSEELMQLEKGKVVKTIHYVGDEIWQAS